jgi:hypothetical protein
MSAPPSPSASAPLDLSSWRLAPNALLIGGGLIAVLGAATNLKQFGYSWLTCFMFFLSICLGGMFLNLMHHAFDASWSVPLRRINEHLANLAPWMALLFIPVALLATRLYPWMGPELQAHPDHGLHAKFPLFTIPGFYIVSLVCLGAWILWANRLRFWSLKQDETGAADCTFRMRVWAGTGVFVFAVTLTFGVIMWMKALYHQWFSTMYGVYYFAGSVWTTIATVYLIALILQRQGPLAAVMRPKQYYFLGSLQFAFTVFYAYIAFSQYFIIWNANLPEETFWYLLREKGSWWDIGQLLIFGHFFLPFLAIIRIDAKKNVAVMVPIIVWAWLMHFADISFNVLPLHSPEGFQLHWITIGCFAFMAGLLSKVFLRNLNAHPVYPQRDPRMAEGLDVYVPPVSAAKRAAH